jgi:hypothetical protein
MLLGAGNAFGQEAPSFKGDGTPFIPVDCEIVWAAPTNQLPKALWVYKTIPQHFSDTTISNLLALASFTTRDKINVTAEELAQLSPEDRAKDEDAFGFENENRRHNLAVYPATGYIFYMDQKVDGIRSPFEDVPSEAMAQELGLILLAQIGIPRSDLANRRDSSEPLTFKQPTTRGHFDREQRKLVKETDSRGVMFVRQIDGVNFAGNGYEGGFYVRFASYAEVAELKLVWRNLQPYKKYQVASPDQIMQWIKEGKAVVVTMPDVHKVNPREVKKLTITEISLLYAGEPGETLQDLTYPFASLSAIVDTGRTNIGIMLYCPILSDKLVGP